MKKNILITVLTFCFLAVIFNSCKDDETILIPSFGVSVTEITFEPTIAGEFSASESLMLQSANLGSSVNVSSSSNFEVSKNNIDFVTSLVLTVEELNNSTAQIYVRFSPTLEALGNINGNLVFLSNDFSEVSVSLTATALEIPHGIQTIGAIESFGDIIVTDISSEQVFQVKGINLENDLIATVSGAFEISKDNITYTTSITFDFNGINAVSENIYVRFIPSLSDLGVQNGAITLTSVDVDDVVIDLVGNGLEIPREIQNIGTVGDLGEVTVGTVGTEQMIQVKGLNLENDVTVSVTGLFEISKNNTTYSNTVNYAFGTINSVEEDLYIRFIPGATDLGVKNGVLTLSAIGVDDVVINITGTGIPVAHNYVAFNLEALAFGGSFNQSATQNFTLHPDLTNIAQIKMFVQIDCPGTGCDDWDRFANVKIKDVSTGDWYELGRYITPYWTGTQQLARGLEFDVTDFKSLLTGTVELRIYIENWTAKADLITVDFDFIEGTPDYEFYEVAGVLQYNASSIDGVPYGEAHTFDLDKSITIPANAESTHLRSVISGWGHATGSPGSNCAEWCFRTHDVKINGTNTFEHYMGSLGCSSNPVSNQDPGNWEPNRAGWCPGMGVPTRIDAFATSMAGSMFTFEYDYEDWTNNMGNGNAYYATSTYVVVKSSTPITKPTVN